MALRAFYNEIKGMKVRELPSYLKPKLLRGIATSRPAPSSPSTTTSSGTPAAVITDRGRRLLPIHPGLKSIYMEG
ncbi:unnamed protein product [Musa acuminata subsp. malaccensis]|uniref:(wild Malaysian banana) hypothetical protein n=1 Tax=Musa acuminata subsp. malaccensis TaxID=214687 RepID=A0A804HP06_MUSAM|nr:unnamed protein product [Musa acuminata subsp. malaccensis]